MNVRLYTIKEVAAQTGLSTQLIRKWEERYGAVAPSRFPNGYRGYTKQDVERLVWLKSLVDAGVPIGMAVQERHSGTEEILSESETPVRVFSSEGNGLQTVAGAGGAEQLRDRLVTSLVELDDVQARRIMDEIMSIYHLEYVLLEILQPVLVRIGVLWESGCISEYQEHFSSHFVRDRLLSIKSFFAVQTGAKTLVTACSPNERHELGILIVGLFALQLGMRVIHLGTSPSEKGILDCLERCRPDAFAFGVSSREVLDGALGFFRSLDDRIRKEFPDTLVFIGGRIVEADGPVEGMTHSRYVAGCAREAVRKIKSVLDRI